MQPIPSETLVQFLLSSYTNFYTLNLHFQHKEYAILFLGVLFFIVLFYRLIKWKKRVINTIGDRQLVQLLIANFSSRKFNTKFAMLSTGFAMGVLALMNPRLPAGQNEINRKGIDVVIALDVSNSMLATDVGVSRINKSKQFIEQLIHTMPDNRYALVIFAGAAYLQMPLTFDLNATSLFIKTASVNSISKQGTNISQALEKSAGAFPSIASSYKSIILISDGEEHEQDAVKTTAQLASQGIMINTVGVGGEIGTTILDAFTGIKKTDNNGNEVKTALNQPLLQEIAAKTSGLYLRLEDIQKSVTQISNHIGMIEKSSLKDKSLMNYANLFVVFSIIMFLLLLTENFIGERKNKI